jgi:hypothetical protein
VEFRRGDGERRHAEEDRGVAEMMTYNLILDF